MASDFPGDIVEFKLNPGGADPPSPADDPPLGRSPGQGDPGSGNPGGSGGPGGPGNPGAGDPGAGDPGAGDGGSGDGGDPEPPRSTEDKEASFGIGSFRAFQSTIQHEFSMRMQIMAGVQSFLGNDAAAQSFAGIATDFESRSQRASQESSEYFQRAREPIFIDLASDGLQLLSWQTGSSTAFDIDNDGFAERVTWSSNDALLVRDTNHNGVIDNGHEISFSDSGEGLTDFERLRSYDLNNDGIIDQSDAIYHDLMFWVDANRDGISQPVPPGMWLEFGVA